MGIEKHIKHALVEAKYSQDSDNDDSLYIKSAMTTVHKSLLLLFIAVLLMIVLAAQARIDIVVSSRGEMLLDSDIERVQHLEGGILDAMLVKAGDYVYAGQPIARLRSVDRNTQLESATLDIASLEMDILRYISLINQTEPDFTAYGNFPHLIAQYTESCKKRRRKTTPTKPLSPWTLSTSRN